MLTAVPAARSVREPIAVPEQVSPELVLVDPDLRRLLIEQYASDVLETPVEPLSANGIAAVSPLPARSGVRSHGRPQLRLLLAALGGSAATLFGVLVADLVTSSPARVITSVAAAPLKPPPSRHTTHATLQPSSEVFTAARPTSTLSTARNVKPKATPPPQVRQFAWAPVPGASAYEVAFFRNNVRAYDIRTRRAIVSITEGLGKTNLSPGTYQWYVWPIRSGRRVRVAVVRSRFVVPGARVTTAK
jgi:hypothetical protein